jgi:hypothetical protein
MKKIRRASRRAGFFLLLRVWGLGGRTMAGRAVQDIGFLVFLNKFLVFLNKKQGAAGITTAAPRIAGQWGRGDNRLP